MSFDLSKVADALESRVKARITLPAAYRNKKYVEGRHFKIQHERYFYSISIHNFQSKLDFEDLGASIRNGKIPTGKEGSYSNEKGLRGEYATVDTDLGWCMIGISSSQAEVDNARRKATSMSSNPYHGLSFPQIRARIAMINDRQRILSR